MKSFINLERIGNLLVKSNQDLNLVKLIIKDDGQHDNAGYHLSQATEKVLKIFHEIKSVSYDRSGKNGHNLMALFENLDKIKDLNLDEFKDLIDLEVYDSNSRYEIVFESDRLKLQDYLEICRKFHSLALGEYRKVTK